jgi:cytochrome b subunit of formate dehydrogenase
VRNFSIALFVLSSAGLLGGAQKSTDVKTPNSVCAECHDEETKLKASAHNGVACANCHVRHDQYPHPENVPKPACQDCHAATVRDYHRSEHYREVSKGNPGAPDCAFCHGASHEIKVATSPEAHMAVPALCGGCHDKELAAYQDSVHGKAVARGLNEAPVCTDCHSAHGIESPKRPGSTVSAAAVPDTCGRCHGDLRLMQRFGLNSNQVTTFATSFHGLALRAGQTSVADCASCHGYHDILPSSDPRSRINPRNIPKTCGKCHPGAGTRFPLGQIHAVAVSSEPLPLQYVRLFYLVLIPWTIGFMLLHHLGDFLRKTYSMSFRSRSYSTRMLKPPFAQLRMHPWERTQHLLLMLSFITLAYTGFALHYPDEWWSRPLLRWEATYPVRGTVHRVAGAILVITAVTHVVTLFVNRVLREHWKELIPRASDLREIVEGTLWRLGLRAEKPYQSPHSYIEKAEYWALVWGTVIMAASGIFLWANNWTLKFLPKIWYDLARAVHYYEAVLATLAIFVWHFYSVIFDPEVYPMDPAWITGYSPRIFSDSHSRGDRTSR